MLRELPVCAKQDIYYFAGGGVRRCVLPYSCRQRVPTCPSPSSVVAIAENSTAHQHQHQYFEVCDSSLPLNSLNQLNLLLAGVLIFAFLGTTVNDPVHGPWVNGLALAIMSKCNIVHRGDRDSRPVSNLLVRVVVCMCSML